MAFGFEHTAAIFSSLGHFTFSAPAGVSQSTRPQGGQTGWRPTHRPYNLCHLLPHGIHASSLARTDGTQCARHAVVPYTMYIVSSHTHTAVRTSAPYTMAASLHVVVHSIRKVRKVVAHTYQAFMYSCTQFLDIATPTIWVSERPPSRCARNQANANVMSAELGAVPHSCTVALQLP